MQTPNPPSLNIKTKIPQIKTPDNPPKNKFSINLTKKTNHHSVVTSFSNRVPMPVIKLNIPTFNHSNVNNIQLSKPNKYNSSLPVVIKIEYNKTTSSSLILKYD